MRTSQTLPMVARSCRTVGVESWLWRDEPDQDPSGDAGRLGARGIHRPDEGILAPGGWTRNRNRPFAVQIVGSSSSVHASALYAGDADAGLRDRVGTSPKQSGVITCRKVLSWVHREDQAHSWSLETGASWGPAGAKCPLCGPPTHAEGPLLANLRPASHAREYPRVVSSLDIPSHNSGRNGAQTMDVRRFSRLLLPLVVASCSILPLAAGTANGKSRAKQARRPVLPDRAAPAGYYIDSLDAVKERPTWREEKEGSFTYSIRREFSDSTEARMLGIAEAVYPPRDSLVVMAVQRNCEMGADSAGVPLWWYRGIGVRRIPYAVTAGTLEHFLKLTERFRSHNFWETGTGGGLWWTDFIYHARVFASESFTYRGSEYAHVYVVLLVFAWSYDDGTFVPVTETRRTVVLSERGDVLAVEGDGAAEEKVHFSEHRGIGRVDHIMR